MKPRTALAWLLLAAMSLDTYAAVVTHGAWCAFFVALAALSLLCGWATARPRPEQKSQGERRTVYPLSPLRLVPGPCKAEGCVRPQSHDGAHLFDVEEA